MRKRGFTLIELLVVISIITLLVVVASTSYLTAQRNARDNARKTSLNALATSLEAYRLTTSQYPGITNPSVVANLVGIPTGSSDNFCIANETYYYAPQGKCATARPAGNNQIAEGTAVDVQKKHRPSEYAPEPNWIPGMGKLLNPAIVERRYNGVNGEDAAASFDPGTGKPYFDAMAAPTSNNRTYSYKRTSGGYNVFVTLENLDAYPNHVYSLTK